MKNIAVFFGGVSVEHDVSVITGVLTLNSLNKDEYNAIPIYVSNDGKWFTGKELYDIENYKNLNVKKLKQVCLVEGENVLYIKKRKALKKIASIATAINCMHGARGEDGSLSGLLNLCGIANASPDMFSSALSIDKSLTKVFLKGLNIKYLPCITAVGLGEINEIERKLGYPVICKPAKCGSSIGISTANDKDSLSKALSLALSYDSKVVVEKLLTDFTEINCAVYKNYNNEIIVSECEKPIGAGEVLSFNDKYVQGQREFPAKIPTMYSKRIKDISQKIYSVLSFNGIIRIDFLIDKTGVYVNEINSVPGSLAYYLFCDTLKEFSALLTEVIKLGEKNFAIESSLVKNYSSRILNISGSKSSKRL